MTRPGTHERTPMEFVRREREPVEAARGGRTVAYSRWIWVFSCPVCGREQAGPGWKGGRTATPRCKGMGDGE